MHFSSWLLENSPVIVGKKNEFDGFPYIDIAFPSGEIWRYTFPNQGLLDFYWRDRLNVGRMLSKLKKDPRVKGVSHG